MPADDIFNSLYYALGNRFSGIDRFEREFLRAEDSLEYDTIEELLKILDDKTLYQDNKRLPWYLYLKARLSLLYGRPTETEQILAQIDKETLVTLPELAPRIKVLQTRLVIMNQEFVKAIDSLRNIIYNLEEYDSMLVTAEAHELLARAYIGRTQLSGNWSETPQHGVGKWVTYVSRISLMPFLVPLWLWIWARTGIPQFIQPLWRHSAASSNWPVFTYYVLALSSVHRARYLLEQYQETYPDAHAFRRFSLKLLETDLFRFLHIPQKAIQGYETLIEEYAHNDYYLALLKHGLGYAYFDQGDLERSQEALNEAEILYENAHANQQGQAHLYLIKGEVELHFGNSDTALELWRKSLHTFKATENKTGLAQILALFHAIREGFTNSSAAITENLPELLEELSPKIFTVRLPTRSFKILQRLGWLAPAVALFAFFRVIGGSIGFGTYEDLKRLAVNAPTIGLSAVVLSMLALGVSNGVLGLCWLFFSRWTETTSLDYFITDSEHIRYFNSHGKKLWELHWAQVTTYVQVNRCVWNTPTYLLSFDILQNQQGDPLLIPGVTNALPILREEIVAHVHESVQQQLVSRLYGGVWFLVTAFVFFVAFALTEFVLRDSHISILVHAFLASGLTLITYVSLFVFLSREYVFHLTNTWHICAERRFMIGMAAAGLALIVLSVLSNRWGIFVTFEPLIACIGLALSIGSLRSLTPTSFAARKLVVSIGQYIIRISGVLVVAWLTSLIVVRVFGYAMVRSVRVEPDWTVSEPERQASFTALDQCGRLIQVLDPENPFNSLYQGLAAHARQDYASSVKFFAEGLEITNGDKDFALCLAMTCHKINDSQCEGIQESFEQEQSGGFVFICNRVFPSDSNGLLSETPSR